MRLSRILRVHGATPFRAMSAPKVTLPKFQEATKMYAFQKPDTALSLLGEIDGGAAGEEEGYQPAASPGFDFMKTHMQVSDGSDSRQSITKPWSCSLALSSVMYPILSAPPKKHHTKNDISSNIFHPLQALCLLQKGENELALKLQSDVVLHYKQYLSITGMTSDK